MAEATVLLNTCCTVLTKISWQDAVRLIVLGKAEAVVVDEDRPIRSKNFSMPFPKVVRLLRWVYVRVKETLACTKRGILERDGRRCGYCGRGNSRTVDHVIPSSKGGKLTWTNAICSCVPCNTRKGNRTPEQARMPLLWEPFVPVRYEDLQKEIWALL